MPEPLLSNPQTSPSEEVIFPYLGKARPLWEAFFVDLAHAHPDATPEWRYYKDGKSWLMKVTAKKKTLCWVNIEVGGFRATCYFSDTAADAIAASELPDDLKQQFAEGKHYGKIRALVVPIRRKADLSAARTMLVLRNQAK